VGAGLIVPQISKAGVSGWVKDQAIMIATNIVYLPLRLLSYVASFSVKIAGNILNWSISPDFLKNLAYTNPARNPIIQTGLNVTQSLVNMALVLILIFIALATILSLREYQAQKLLPVFIVIALLVNFTPVICGLIVDASNILMNFFVQQIKADSFGEVISQKMTAINIELEDESWTERWEAKGAELLFLVPFMFLLAFILLIFSLLFLLRHIAIWILVILSPLAFLAYILPRTRSWWSMWWTQFIGWCFVGVTCGFFLYLSLFFVLNIQTSVPAPDDLEANASSEFASFIPYFVGIVFLSIGLLVGLKTSAMGATTAISFAKRAQIKGAKRIIRRAGKTTMAAGKRLGMERRVRQTADRLAKGMAKAGNIRIPGIRLKPFAGLKWVIPEKVKDFGNLRPKIEAAEKAAAKESGVTSYHDILSQRVTNVDATGKMIKSLKGNDAQDLFIAARQFRRWKGMSDQEILEDKRFNQIMTPLLKNAAASGFLGSTLRRDPRLAKIAFRSKIGSYGDRTKIKTEQEAVSRAVNEARSHLNDWEPESLNDPTVLQAAMANLERDRWLQVNRNIKAGRTTSLASMDKVFSDFIRNSPEFAGKKDNEIKSSLNEDKVKDYRTKFRAHINKNYGGDGYFTAMDDHHFRETGWRQPEFVITAPSSAGPRPGPGTTPAPGTGAPGAGTTPPPGTSPSTGPRTTPTTPGSSLGMGPPSTGKAGKKKTKTPSTGKAGKKKTKTPSTGKGGKK